MSTKKDETIYDLFKNSLDDCLRNNDFLVCTDPSHIQEYANKISNDPLFSIVNEELQAIIDEITTLRRIYTFAAKKYKEGEYRSIDEAILKEKENWVSNQLTAYFKKWYIGDSGFTFPYRMTTGKSDIITIDIINKNKEDIDSPLKFFELTIDESIDFQNYNITDETLLGGKGYPELLKTAAWLLNEKNPINDSNVDSLFFDKLESNCIGVDCSGFVSRALAYLFTALKKPYKDQKKSLGVYKIKDDIKTYTYAEDGQNLALKTNVTSIDGGGDKFAITNKDKISQYESSVKVEGMRPGDILIKLKRKKETKDKKTQENKLDWQVGHVKIISTVEREEGKVISFTTMESASLKMEEKSRWSTTKVIKKNGVRKTDNKLSAKKEIIILGEVPVLDDNNIILYDEEIHENKKHHKEKDLYVVQRVPILKSFYGIADDMCKE